VENRAGAGGNLALDVVAKAPKDGLTIAVCTPGPLSINPFLLPSMPFDPVADIAPVSLLAIGPNILAVGKALPARDVAGLVALAKAKPGTLTYGSSGTGGLSHLSGALLGTLAGIDINHVPYKGGAPALTDVISGQIQMLFSTILQAHAHLASGRLRPLAVTTVKRSRALPDLPTMQEAGVRGYEVAGWYGVVAPAKLPKPLIAKLNADIVRALKTPEVADRMAADGSEPLGTTPEQFGAHIKSEVAKWRDLIQKAGIRAE